MNQLDIDKIKADLARIIDSTDFFFDTRPVETFPTRYKIPSIVQFTKLGYATFILRLRANALSVLSLLRVVDKNNWSLYHHSIAILNRASLLDCLYIMAWDKDRNFIKELLADSFQNLERNKYWRLSELQKASLNNFRNMFCNTKINVKPSRILEIVGDECRPVYLLYDWYSKTDHFSVLDSMIFRLKAQDQVDFLEQATKVIIESIKALYLIFEKDATIRNVLIKKLSR
ncbi:hypothetical protein [Dyadobacter sp.]|jgi:hypothetical protein|uniref:hypothetical protein n=1 Tax=Dyadobacter sp. TaxID=1914288 RepID=UPI003F72258E